MDKIKNGVTRNNMIRNNDAITNIEVTFAITLLIGMAMVVSQMMPTISHEDRDWRIKQYMTVVRTTDSLVQDEGESGWEINFKNGNYSNVIGLAYIGDNRIVKKVLDIEKVKTIMGKGYVDNSTGIVWWEFPYTDANITTRNNFARMLGLSGYNFYMQLHPVGLNCYDSLKCFDSVPLQTNLSSRPINFDTVSIVDRYVYILDPSITGKIKYLKYDNDVVHYRLNVWIW